MNQLNDDMSIVLRIDYGTTSFIFTGDAEYTSEYMMIDSGLPLAADVLKVGHHGSTTSSATEFLEAVHPKYAVISCGKYNGYGHPHQETLDSLKKLNTEVFRTDLQGTIICRSDGETISFLPERETEEDLFASPRMQTEESDVKTNPIEELFGEESSREDDKIAPYCIVALVIHHQESDIVPQLQQLESSLAEAGFPQHCIHAEPIIRRENEYALEDLHTRQGILKKLIRERIYSGNGIVKMNCGDE